MTINGAMAVTLRYFTELRSLGGQLCHSTLSSIDTLCKKYCFNNSSAIAEMAAQCCTIRIFAIKCGLPLCNAHYE